MAINIPLHHGADGPFPLPFQGEAFLLTRDKTRISFKDATRSVKHLKGRLYMTNLRMVFMVSPNDRAKADCETFEMPFRGLWDEAFHQPIFGCNNLTATIQFYDDQPFSGNLTMRIDFVEGGVNTFLPLFNNVLHATRVQLQREQQAQQYIPPVSISSNTPAPQQYFPNQDAAFLDPQDPSRIYTTQPAMGEYEPRQNAPEWSVSGANLRRR